MSPSPLQTFLMQYGWAIQLMAVIAFAWVAGWSARRAIPRTTAGWTYAHYPLLVKALALVGLVFLTAAFVYNGRRLFAEDWWVPPVILTVTFGTYWFAYEVFVTTVRWNRHRLQVFRPPFPAISITLDQITSCKHHPTTESITLRSADGSSVWIPYSFRVGMDQLFSLLASPSEDTEA